MRNPASLGKVGLFAAGGGFRGAALAGFARGLVKNGIFINHLSGVSVSALEFAKLSEARNLPELAHKAQEVVDMFLAIERAGPSAVFRMSKYEVGKHLLLSKPSLMEKSGLISLLRNFDPAKSVNSPIDFDFAVFDENEGKQKIISNRDPRFTEKPEKLRPLCIASASLRPFFEASVIDGVAYSDGGYLNLEQVGRCGCNTVFVFFSRPENYRQASFPPDSFVARHFPWLPAFLDMHAAGLYRLEEQQLELLKFRLDAARKDRVLAAMREGSWPVRKITKMFGAGLSYLFQGATGACRVEVVRAENIPLTLATADFNPADITEAIRLGERLADEKAEELLAE